MLLGGWVFPDSSFGSWYRWGNCVVLALYVLDAGGVVGVVGVVHALYALGVHGADSAFRVHSSPSIPYSAMRDCTRISLIRCQVPVGGNSIDMRLTT